LLYIVDFQVFCITLDWNKWPPSVQFAINHEWSSPCYRWHQL